MSNKFTWSARPVLPQYQQIQQRPWACSSPWTLGLLLERTQQNHPGKEELKKNIRWESEGEAQGQIRMFTGHVGFVAQWEQLCNQYIFFSTSCHSTISHNLPRNCFCPASPAGQTAGTWRSLAPPAPHSCPCLSPSGIETPLPQRQRGWWYDPSWWFHLQRGSWLLRWQNWYYPPCHPVTICWSYLQIIKKKKWRSGSEIYLVYTFTFEAINSIENLLPLRWVTSGWL